MGGNVGGLIHKSRIGTMLRSVLGAIGGAIGGMGMSDMQFVRDLNLEGNMAQAGSAGVVGLLLTAVAGFFFKKKPEN